MVGPRTDNLTSMPYLGFEPGTFGVAVGSPNHYPTCSVSADRFSRVLFRHFYPKIVTNADFDCVFPNIWWFNRKSANAVWFSNFKNKNSYNFYAITIKTDFRNRSEIREFRQKRAQNHFKMSILPPFFLNQKSTAFIDKQKTLVDFLL